LLSNATCFQAFAFQNKCNLYRYVAALRELWPEEAFKNSDEQNPFFAEELALAIKALNGKGKEKPWKPM
jgi:hypothetical protein